MQMLGYREPSQIFYSQRTWSAGGEVANKLRYTGREFDRETGLYYYRARYYDPESGRFYTEDPLGFRAGINFYAYVDNNPINANDPTGLVTNDPMDSFSKRMLRMPGQLFAGAIDFARETFLPPSFTLSAGPGVGLTGTGVNIELSGGITVGTHKDSTIFMIEGSLLINKVHD